MTTATRLTNVDGLKQELFDNIDIVTVAERLGLELTSSGGQYRALCPFHDENTPSWYCQPAKGLTGVYHCFGCKAKGDAIDLVQQLRHLSFPEALYWLAAEADVDISQYERPLTESEREREEFRQWCEVWLAPPGEPPQRTSAASAQEFGVGLRAAMDPPPYFRDKGYLLDGVVLPWRTPSGQLLGWRVREHEGEPKQVRGTPNDFPLGHLSDTLFGIQLAREYIEDEIVLIEGEYDVITVVGAGHRNVVGMGGSSLTEGQLKLLESLHIRRAVAVFDGDEGGYKAALAFAQKHWQHDSIFFRVIVCPDGMDPEDVIKEHGDLHWLLLTTSAKSCLEYLLREEWSARPRTTLSEKLEFVQWIRDNYGAALRSTDESLVLSEVAKWLEIPELDVRDYVRAADGSLCATDSERMLLGKACRDKEFYVKLRARLVREDFFMLRHQRLWDLLADMLIEGQEFDPLTVIAKAPAHGVPEEYLAGCLALSEANWEYHLGVVADLSLRRSARDAAVGFQDRIADLGQPAGALVGDLTSSITAHALRHTGMAQRQLSEQVDEAMDTLHERMRNPTEIWGLDLGTQYPNLSRLLQGLQAGRLYLVAAVSRIGKSTMLCQWAAAIGVHQSIPIDFVSLEMDEHEILYKLASHLTSIDSTKISGGRLNEHEARAVEQAMVRIRNSPLHIWTPDGLTSSEFLLYARESVMRRRTQAFFVDYVQLIDPEQGQERDNGYKLYGDFGRFCKMKVARAMNTVVVCAAQLARSAAEKEKPSAEDIGDSYALVRHSNVVIILHGREDSSTLECWVDKNRGGQGGGLVPMVYLRPTQTFYEASGGAHEPEYAIRI